MTVTHSNIASTAKQSLATYASTFWQRQGFIQTYADFILTEIDPLLSRAVWNARVVEIIRETPDAKTYVLKPPARWKGFVAGQHFQIGVEINGTRVRRTYTLSSTPAEYARTGTIRFTTKRIQDGRVSNWLFDHLTPGTIIQIAPASGEFTLAASNGKKPLFLAAGSGITPFYSMLKQHLGQPKTPAISMLYYCRNSSEVIFAEALAELQRQHPEQFKLTLVLTDTDGFISQAQLQQHCPDLAERTVFMCGPQGFMDKATELLAAEGIDAGTIIRESFGAPYVRVSLDPSQRQSEVAFTKAGIELKGDGSKTLLEMAEAAGLTPKFGCRSGICHECKCTKRGGQVIDARTGKLSSPDQEEIQACIAIPVGPVEVEL